MKGAVDSGVCFPGFKSWLRTVVLPSQCCCEDKVRSYTQVHVTVLGEHVQGCSTNLGVTQSPEGLTLSLVAWCFVLWSFSVASSRSILTHL